MAEHCPTDQPAEQRPLKGIAGVITDSNGNVVAHHADFDRFAPGGFSRAEAQKMRVRIGLARRFFEAFLVPRLTEHAEPEFVMDFWRNAERHGYRMTFLPIGWTAEEARL